MSGSVFCDFFFVFPDHTHLLFDVRNEFHTYLFIENLTTIDWFLALTLKVTAYSAINHTTTPKLHARARQSPGSLGDQHHMDLDARHPDFVACKQQKRRPSQSGYDI